MREMSNQDELDKYWQSHGGRDVATIAMLANHAAEIEAARNDGKREGKREQLEQDCAVICSACAGTPDMGGEWIKPAILVDKLWRHPYGKLDTKQEGTLRCQATKLRNAALQAPQ